MMNDFKFLIEINENVIFVATRDGQIWNFEADL